MSNALSNALNRALEEGREQEKKETALKMLNDGISAKTILKYVEVSPDVLRKWQLEQHQNERE